MTMRAGSATLRTGKGSDPLVSVYVPTHNRPGMLLRALQSVWAQDYRHIELIVCDDASDEDTTAPPARSLFGSAESPSPRGNLRLRDVRELAESRGVRWLRNATPGGACVARNHAIEAATGELITGLDDDDEFRPDRVRTLVEQYDGTGSLVAHSYLEFNGQESRERTFDCGIIDYDRLLHYNRIGNQVLTETSRMREVGLFDVNMPAMQDYDMWLRLVRQFGPARKWPACSYCLHTEHESGRISGKPERVVAAYEQMAQKYRDDLQRHHRDSHRLLMARTSGDRLGLVEIIRRCNPHNLRLALSVARRQWGI